jgi:hypothetical protein
MTAPTLANGLAEHYFLLWLISRLRATQALAKAQAFVQP